MIKDIEVDKKGIVHIYRSDNGIDFTEIVYYVKNMITPVICNHCGKVYDLTTVSINHRYGDCDQFTTPCCDYKFADTREWKSFKDFNRI